jgi:4-amino-4-deoxy-L-arabinose transferase-like glycosyltransferase
MPTRSAGSRLLEAFALLAVLTGLVAALDSRPLWEPLELETAELARRIAHGLFGAEALGNGQEAVPTRGELGRGELPFLLVALGFCGFGASAAVGRVVFALCGVLGMAALYLVTRRFASRRAAAIAVLGLASSPLYALHARTLTGEITVLAATSLAFAGWFLLVFERESANARRFGALLAALGVVSGFLSRGVLVGVAPAALGVGLPWLACALPAPSRGRGSPLAGALVLAFGLVAVAAGLLALATTERGEYSLWLGASFRGFAAAPTFDGVARDLLHAAFPWSALFVPAIASVLATTSEGGQGPLSGSSASPRALLGLAAISTAAVALIVQTALAPSLELGAYAAPFALSLAVGLALDDSEQQRRSTLFAPLILLVGTLLVLDFRQLPGKLLVALGTANGALPELAERRGFGALPLASLVGFGLAALLLAESAPATARLFQRAPYQRWIRCFQRLWNGRLAFAAIALGAALIGLDLALSVGALSDNPAFPPAARWTARAGWLAVLAACLLPLVALFVRDGTRALLARGRLGRGASAAVVLSLLGLAQSLVFVPELLRGIESPPVLAAYERRAREQEPLVLLGDILPVARYRSARPFIRAENVETALSFLDPKRKQRAFVALRASELARVNAAFRARARPRANLLVLDAEPSELLLATNRLLPGERDQNPFRELFPERAPVPARPLSAELERKLELFGWELRDLEGRVRDSVIGGEPYELSLFFRVRERLSEDWKIFVHVDGFQQRLNADHAPLAGLAPTSSWLADDWVIDRHRLRIDASFLPGVYGVYAGLYRGEQRLSVTRGAAGADRVFLGELRVD